MAQAERGMPSSVVTSPPRDFGPNAARIPILTPTSSQSITCSRNMCKGTRRSNACGPARSGQRARPGALRADTWCGAIFRTIASCAGSKTMVASASSALPSNNSNGNTFDFQGRQMSCEHLTRRVVRYEHDGSVTVIADSYNRQAPQLAQRRRPSSGRQHLFTDPPYGGQPL